MVLTEGYLIVCIHAGLAISRKVASAFVTQVVLTLNTDLYAVSGLFHYTLVLDDCRNMTCYAS